MSFDSSETSPARPSASPAKLRDNYGFEVPTDLRDAYLQFLPTWEVEEQERTLRWDRFFIQLRGLASLERVEGEDDETLLEWLLSLENEDADRAQPSPSMTAPPPPPPASPARTRAAAHRRLQSDGRFLFAGAALATAGGSGGWTVGGGNVGAEAGGAGFSGADACAPRRTAGGELDEPARPLNGDLGDSPSARVSAPHARATWPPAPLPGTVSAAAHLAADELRLHLRTLVQAGVPRARRAAAWSAFLSVRARAVPGEYWRLASAALGRTSEDEGREALVVASKGGAGFSPRKDGGARGTYASPRRRGGGGGAGPGAGAGDAGGTCPGAGGDGPSVPPPARSAASEARLAREQLEASRKALVESGGWQRISGDEDGDEPGGPASTCLPPALAEAERTVTPPFLPSPGLSTAAIVAAGGSSSLVRSAQGGLPAYPPALESYVSCDPSSLVTQISRLEQEVAGTGAGGEGLARAAAPSEAGPRWPSPVAPPAAPSLSSGPIFRRFSLHRMAELGDGDAVDVAWGADGAGRAEASRPTRVRRAATQSSPWRRAATPRGASGERTAQQLEAGVPERLALPGAPEVGARSATAASEARTAPAAAGSGAGTPPAEQPAEAARPGHPPSSAHSSPEARSVASPIVSRRRSTPAAPNDEGAGAGAHEWAGTPAALPVPPPPAPPPPAARVMATPRDMPEIRAQIEKDLHRTFPRHASLRQAGRARLRRVLAAYAVRNPRVGYCQGMNFVAAFLLLALRGDEERAFWSLCAVVEDVVPGYFDGELLVPRVDALAFAHLARASHPRAASRAAALDVDLASIALPWLLTLFVASAPAETALRIWDVALLEGSPAPLLRTGLALLDLFGGSLASCEDPADAYALLSAMPGLALDASRLVDTAAIAHRDVGDAALCVLREKYRRQVLPGISDVDEYDLDLDLEDSFDAEARDADPEGGEEEGGMGGEATWAADPTPEADLASREGTPAVPGRPRASTGDSWASIDSLCSAGSPASPRSPNPPSPLSPNRPPDQGAPAQAVGRPGPRARSVTSPSRHPRAATSGRPTSGRRGGASGGAAASDPSSMAELARELGALAGTLGLPPDAAARLARAWGAGEDDLGAGARSARPAPAAESGSPDPVAGARDVPAGPATATPRTPASPESAHPDPLSAPSAPPDPFASARGTPGGTGESGALASALGRSPVPRHGSARHRRTASALHPSELVSGLSASRRMLLREAARAAARGVAARPGLVAASVTRIGEGLGGPALGLPSASPCEVPTPLTDALLSSREGARGTGEGAELDGDGGGAPRPARDGQLTSTRQARLNVGLAEAGLPGLPGLDGSPPTPSSSLALPAAPLGRAPRRHARAVSFAAGELPLAELAAGGGWRVAGVCAPPKAQGHSRGRACDPISLRGGRRGGEVSVLEVAEEGEGSEGGRGEEAGEEGGRKGDGRDPQLAAPPASASASRVPALALGGIVGVGVRPRARPTEPAAVLPGAADLIARQVAKVTAEADRRSQALARLERRAREEEATLEALIAEQSLKRGALQRLAAEAEEARFGLCRLEALLPLMVQEATRAGL